MENSNQPNYPKDKLLSGTKELPRVLYTPESQMRRPVLLLRLMWRDLLASRELAWRLLIRDISAQYRQSLLGIVWAFLPPIVSAIGLTFAKNSGFINLGDTDLPYPAYVMFSMTLWQTFIGTLNGPIAAVLQAKPMLVRVNFPREALIIAKLGEVFFNFGIRLILIIGLFIVFRMPLTLSVILAPVALIHLIALGTFIGLLLAPLGGLYRDIQKGITLTTGLWLFITPVIYPPPTEGIFGLIVKLNPVTPLLVTTRELATTGVVSNPSGFWIASSIAIFGLLASWIFYRLSMPFVTERMSS